MGRSKFPGKPSKHVNRTRINVLSTVVNTTVVGDYNPTVVTVEEGDNSKKVDKADSDTVERGSEQPPEKKVLIRKTRKERVSISSKRTPIKRTCLLLSNPTNSPLNTSTRLTRSKVTRRPVRGFNIRNKLTKAKHSISPKKETSNIVGKFVLPSRSVHSSRVIKPNKRFINIEQGETRIVKKRVKKCVKPSETEVTQESESDSVKNESEKTDKSKTESVKSNVESTTSTSHNSGKVVLRQARLQVSTRTPIGPEGPFSTNTASIMTPPGTVTCGVCGAVRFYRFVKQARKFNIYTCESCRKFISKIIQRSNTKTVNTTLKCINGQGMCLVPPMVRSQQWKYNRIAYNSRCPACWLKLCLKSFQMPLALKTSLSQFLPKSMQPNDTLFTSSLPLLTWQSNIETKIDTIPKPIENKDINLRQRPVRLKHVKKDEKPPAAPIISDIKRQKIDLKGPRVKHVCRSASIVLGQPLATFNKEIKDITEKPTETITKPLETKTAPVVDIVSDNKISEKFSDIQEDKTDESAEIIQEDDIIVTKNIKESTVPAQPSKKSKNTTSMLPIEIIKPSFSKKTKKISEVDKQNLIDIDFWENYDPDEIVCNGFGIIAAEKFPMQAICFLCGSAGMETLLHCCICCEPYHPYCLEQAPTNFTNPNDKYSWICPKCTTCSACGEADSQKINCQKCHKAYHPQCFNTKWRTDDRPTVCSNCLRCKSCGTDNITKFVGNLALCLQCFKLRNKGNFCPLCQCCYDDNDFDTKMMECAKCSKWVHAKCEGLSDEQYQILSILPESVEFLCRLCSNQSTPYWRKAVQSELRSCFNNILRLLSKNRVARDMLKLSPFKVCSPITKHLNSARRLEFIDDTETINTDGDNSVENDLEKVNAIFKNKIDFGDSFNGNCSLLNDSKIPMSPSMVEIKSKLNCNEYFSLRDFNAGMEEALNSTSSDELLKIYRSILKKVFPWFDPNLKEDLNKSICDTTQLDKTEEEKKIYENFHIHVTDKVDNRICNLCKGVGDGLPDKEARLLYCGQNDWVHANCALWSSEVYEEIDGSLQNVQSAISRGRSIRCTHCKQKGASVGCCLKGCYETYHFPCAQKSNCHFIADRTIYCKSHELNKQNIISNPREFEIRRSVYIEVDTKKKRFSKKEKVNFMVGSLSVLSLGKIIPCVSDTVDAIIPVGFVCSRLFWSTTEPWKLIPYRITTSIHNTQSQVYVDKNFTVDHTLPKHIVDKRLIEIYLWQRDDKDKNDPVEFEDYEEPQNAADILSPELTDAILEELPHDLLDGISVQDMFMGYEELMMDFKNPEINCNDNLSLNMNNETNDCEEAKVGKELKRSKSEIFQKEDKMKSRSQQRSCSLTWLHDNSPAIKKRKIAPARENKMFMQLLQVDGACDSSSSECGSPTHESEDLWSPDVAEEPVTCEKCQLTYRTNASYKRHLENCDAMFTSESETETDNLVVNVVENHEPQVIASYETYSSFQTTQNQIQSTVLNTQTILAESKLQENNGIFYNYQQVKPIQQNNVINLNHPITINTNTENNQQILNQFCVNQQNVCMNQISQPNLISVDKNALGINPSLISVDNTQVLNQINPMNGMVDIQQPVTLQSVPFTSEVSPIINISQQNQAITIDAKMLAPNLVNSMVNIPQNQWVRPIVPQSKPRPRPRIVAKKTRMQGNTIVLPQNSQSVILQHIPSTNMLPFVDAFQQQGGQNLQYVATISPQINSSIAPQAQLVQLPENNFLSLVPNVQPTMIIQQPRVDTGQLIVDSNGSMVWTTQPVQQVQPVYYGFETIVQNTVMQSQQFLPTTVPGVLTTNSSYSATTQVFQTSKLEPVIDGSFVLVNQNQIVNQPAVSVPQIQANITPQTVANNLHITKPTWNQLEHQQHHHHQQHHQPQQQQQHHHQQQQHHQQQHHTHHQTVQAPQIKPPPVVTTVANNTNSITLPIAPFVPEQGIPTNIVTPTPKPPTSAQCRPMSRVLPMQTNNLQKKQEKLILKQCTNHEIEKIVSNVEKQKIRILEDVVVKECPISPPPVINMDVIKSEILKEIKVEKEKCEVNIKSEPKVKYEPKVKCEAKIKTEVKVKIDELKTEPVVKPEVKETKIEKEILQEAIKINKKVAPLKPVKPKIQTIIENKENTLQIETNIKQNQENIEEPFKPPQKLNQIPKRTNINNTSIYYKIESDDGFDYSAASLPQIWRKVFAEVQASRIVHNLPPLPDIALRTINDIDFLGLKMKGMKYLLEQLPEATKCKAYKPVFHKPSGDIKFEDDDSEEGARRCMPYDNKREKYDMFGWLSSKHRTLEMYDLDAILKKNSNGSLPIAMRFRTLKVVSKFSVGVYRSEIHGRGLFSLRDIESGEMVIEYAGEVIRSVLTDKREKYYNSKGIGCYMFRIDDNLVVDATMKGNAARFINHSCDPNCYSKVVEILGYKHIIIFALRKIICGEELTYDYKFPFEEDKIPCTCGTKRCRKFLN